MTRLCLPVALVAIILAVPLHLRAELAPELLPSYSESYEDLKLISVKGLISSELLNTRPLTRGQVARMLADGLSADREGMLADPVGRRLINKFSGELEAMGIDVPNKRHAPLWSARVTPEENSPVRMEMIPYAWVRVDNVEPLYFSKLEDRRIGYRGTLSTAGGALLLHHDLVVGNHGAEPRGIPDFGTLNALVEGEDMNSWVHRGYIRLSTKITDVVFGRDWIRWGPGRTGTLGMGDAAPALNHLMLRKRTSKFDLASFVSTVDFENEEMLAGHRIELSPFSGFVLGVAEQVRFRGIEQAPLYWLSVIPYSLLEKVVKEDAADADYYRNNVMWSLDADWIPTTRNRLYAEILIDDLSFSRDKKPTQIGYQLGLARSGLGALESLALEAEFTKIYMYTYTQARRVPEEDPEADKSKLDFVRNGYSLGHPIGPDSEDYFFAARYDVSASSKWALGVEMRRSGEMALGDGWYTGDAIPSTSSLSGIVETKTRAMLSYTFSPEWWSGSWATVGGGFRKVTNLRNVEGENLDWDGIMQASFLVSW